MISVHPTPLWSSLCYSELLAKFLPVHFCIANISHIASKTNIYCSWLKCSSLCLTAADWEVSQYFLIMPDEHSRKAAEVVKCFKRINQKRNWQAIAVMVDMNTLVCSLIWFWGRINAQHSCTSSLRTHRPEWKQVILDPPGLPKKIIQKYFL